MFNGVKTILTRLKQDHTETKSPDTYYEYLKRQHYLACHMEEDYDDVSIL